MKGERDAVRRDKVVAALRAGATVSAACKAAGLTRAAVYAWRARGGDPELAELLGQTSSARSRAPLPTPIETPAPGPAPIPAPEPVKPLAPIAAPASGVPRFAPGGMSDDAFTDKLHALGLGVLASLATGEKAAKSEQARVTAARELVHHAERRDAARRAELAALERPDPKRTTEATPVIEPAPEKELTAEAAAARFRIVGGA